LAVDDLVVLNRELPELFARLEPPSEWQDDFVFLPVHQPDALRPDLAASSAPRAENAPVTDLESFLAHDTDAALSLPHPVGVPSGVMLPYGGPGAPVPFDFGVPFPQPDALAFYLPFHYFFPTWWGVYLIAEGVESMSRRLVVISEGQLGLGEAVQVTRLFLYHHEAYHHMVECFATRLELTHRRPLYKDGFEAVYRRLIGTGNCAEEALATAHAFVRTTDTFKRFPTKRTIVIRVLRQWIDRMPPDYRAALHLLGPKRFDQEQDAFAELNQREAVGGRPIHASIWANFPQAFRGIGNIRSRVNYIVPKESPIMARARLRLLRPSELKNALKSLAGCQYLRDGGNHEIWRTRTGKTFLIPRHPRDLATGTLAKIIKQAGLQMSVSDFMQAR
jgi:predicted RNA binding protein YcfA (HicA-like mRNA interferase family)